MTKTPITVHQYFTPKGGLFPRSCLQYVFIDDGAYTYRLKIHKNRVENVKGTKRCMTNGKTVEVALCGQDGFGQTGEYAFKGGRTSDWKEVSKQIPTGLYIDKKRSVVGLLTEGRWVYFSFGKVGLYQIAHTSTQRSLFDRQVLHEAYRRGRADLSERQVLIDGRDSFPGRNRREEIGKCRRQIQKLQIIAAIKNCEDDNKLKVVHAFTESKDEAKISFIAALFGVHKTQQK